MHRNASEIARKLSDQIEELCFNTEFPDHTHGQLKQRAITFALLENLAAFVAAGGSLVGDRSSERDLAVAILDRLLALLPEEDAIGLSPAYAGSLTLATQIRM